MLEQTGHNNYVIATSFNFEVFNAIEKGMKETGAKSRAEYIRNILTLWHDDKGVADVARELVSVKEQRDEHLQACKSHIIEFRSIQELLGIDSGMACPERIVVKIKELMAEKILLESNYDTKLTQIAEALGATISDDDLSNKVSDLKTNLENSAVSAEKDKASIEHLEKIRQTFMKTFHIKEGDIY